MSLSEDEREFRKIFAETAQSTLKAILIMSGGAAVAFLAFLGAVLREPGVAARLGKPAVDMFALAMQSYIFSVTFCVLAFGFAFISHAGFHFKWEKTGWTFMSLCILCWLACLATFVFGSWEGVSGIGIASGIYAR